MIIEIIAGISSTLAIVFILMAGVKATQVSQSVWAKLIVAGALLSIFGMLMPNILSSASSEGGILSFSAAFVAVGTLLSAISVWQYVSKQNT